MTPTRIREPTEALSLGRSRRLWSPARSDRRDRLQAAATEELEELLGIPPGAPLVTILNGPHRERLRARLPEEYWLWSMIRWRRDHGRLGTIRRASREEPRGMEREGGVGRRDLSPAAAGRPRSQRWGFALLGNSGNLGSHPTNNGRGRMRQLCAFLVPSSASQAG